MTTVDTSLGPIVGFSEDGVDVFLGVPYAAPPVGPNRFRHPRPHEPWSDPRPATTFGPAAPQVANALDGLVPGMGVERTDESCLTLNVWTPDIGGERPLLVWLHGGAFSLGGSSQAVYDGARLARRGDVVVATCNYRLGALGFLRLGGVDANCGLADQIAALRWLGENAAALGADPRRITVFGESAGGGSVLSLLASPHAAGAFRRAIVQSGASSQFLTAEKAATVGEAFSTECGVAPGDGDALRGLDLDTLLEAQTRTAASVSATVGIMPWHPTDDGDLLPADWFDAVRAGAGNDIDLLLGTTRDEMALFKSFDPAAAALDRAELVERLGFLHPDPDALLAAYDQADGDVAPPQRWSQVLTDTSMWIPAIRVLDARAGATAGTYAYRFDWPAADAELGACHGIDIVFPFDTFDADGWDRFVADVDGARAVAHTLQDCWAAFAHRGTPATDQLDWPAYDHPQRCTMVLGPTPTVLRDPRASVREFWTT